MISVCFCFLSVILTDVAALSKERHSSIEIIDGEAQTYCDEEWFSFDDMCYRAGDTKKMKLSWEKAAERCRELGGNLASIHSKKLTEFLAVFISMDIQARAWIGLHDRHSESSYVWEDGTPFDFRNWEPGEPSGRNIAQEDCVESLHYSGLVNGAPGQWNDLECTIEREFICQKEKKQSRKSADPRFCPDGGWKLKTSCYHVVETKLTWQEAEDYCIEKHGGHLVTINDYSVNLFIEYVLRNYTGDMWIGVKIKNGFQQQWSSGWYVAFTNWVAEPSYHLDGTCAARTLDNWKIMSCERRLPFICEISTKTAPTLTSSHESFCPVEHAMWRDLGGEFCYYVNPEQLTWSDANFNCLRRGGTLASFHSQTELDILQPFLIPHFLKTEHILWIGFLRRDDQHGGKFAWVDGTQMDYTSWGNGEPNFVKDHHCGEVDPVTMKWHNFLCNHNRASVCSIRKIYSSKNISASSKDPIISYSSGFSTGAIVCVAFSVLFVAALLTIIVHYICARDKNGRMKGITSRLPRFKIKMSRHISDNDIDTMHDDFERMR